MHRLLSCMIFFAFAASIADSAFPAKPANTASTVTVSDLLKRQRVDAADDISEMNVSLDGAPFMLSDVYMEPLPKSSWASVIKDFSAFERADHLAEDPWVRDSGRIHILPDHSDEWLEICWYFRGGKRPLKVRIGDVYFIEPEATWARFDTSAEIDASFRKILASKQSGQAGILPKQRTRAEK